MRLLGIRVRGFQSFADTGELEFREGINLLIGQNNSGKSALLRAMLPEFPDDRHRTPELWESFRLPQPQVDFKIEFSGAEMRDWVLRSATQQYLPSNQGNSSDNISFADYFFSKDRIVISVKRNPGTQFYSEYPSHRLFVQQSGMQAYAAGLAPKDGRITISVQAGEGDTLPALLSSAWQRDMFYFAAERTTVGEAAYGHAIRLSPIANNLPNVLHALNSERGDLFKRLVRHLRDVFSTVGNVTARIKPDNNNIEVRIWPTEFMERVELSFPLNSCGTGVSQVLAILTAVMTVDKAVIIIDEINSFLHPAAVKSLIRILQTTYGQHQYIISTHAPEVISFSNPTSVYLAKRSGYVSTLERLDLAKLDKLRDVAEHLGISMADVFAAENIIWVEGPTEELCFPFIYQHFFGPLPRGVLFTAVAATGDFNTKKRDSAIVYEIYQRLSSASTSLVVSVRFSFDTEKLSETDKADMQRRSRNLLWFLPRRHLECYLINQDAIADFINERDTSVSVNMSAAEVEEAIKAAAAVRPLLVPEWNGNITDTDWLERVDAANLIAKVCADLSEQRLAFNKKNDSLFILKKILDRDPLFLKPLGDYVRALVEGSAPGDGAQGAMAETPLAAAQKL